MKGGNSERMVWWITRITEVLSYDNGLDRMGSVVPCSSKEMVWKDREKGEFVIGCRVFSHLMKGGNKMNCEHHYEKAGEDYHKANSETITFGSNEYD